MPTLTVHDNIQFHYTDSGPPQEFDYATLFIIHGHTFHSGTFSRISSSAASYGLRIICVNRREYPGSSPYSPEELRVINEGSRAERAKFLFEQGTLLCLLVDRLIEDLSLPKEGGVTITGSAMGAIFALAMLTAINGLSEDIRERLKAHVHKLLLWDPPAPVVGIADPPGSYIPLFDLSLPPEARMTSFAVWVSSHFKHGDLSLHDFSQLNQRDPDPSKQPTVLKMTPEELAAITDSVPGPKCDSAFLLPSFTSVLWDQANKALFDPAYREQWAGFDVWHMYGDANSWIMLNTVWSLEERTKGNEVFFKRIRGANHFLMLEEPEQTLLLLKECVGH